jgi:hypothetical protein
MDMQNFVLVPINVVIRAMGDTRMYIIREFVANPGLMMSDYCKILNQSLPQMSKLMRKMFVYNLITVRKIGRSVYVYPTNTAIALIAQA